MTDRMQALMDQAYARWNTEENRSKTKQWFWDSLDAGERFAVFMGNMNYQVENGGFEQWLGNEYATPETVGYIRRRLQEMPGPASQVVRGLLAEFVEHVNPDGVDHAGNYQQRGEDDPSLYDTDLDTRYYAVNQAFLAECEEFLAKMEAGR